MSKSFEKLPGVLSFCRCIAATDALFFNLLESGAETPLSVTRSGLRGTQNINQHDLAARAEVSNIQVTDTAKTSVEATDLVVRMAVAYHPLNRGLNACALSKTDPEELLHDFRRSYEDFIEKAEKSKGLLEVARRFARNIANGRWLWRNRKLAVDVTVEVAAGNQSFNFDALSIPLNHFDAYSNDEAALGDIICESLAGKAFSPLNLKATINFGKGLNACMEVYPSQNYLGKKKPKGFARSLYYVGDKPLAQSQDVMNIESSRVLGQAAIRDTKAANALRTIDTWYPEFDDYHQPIAVELAGANLEAQRIFRTGEDTAFAYAKRLNDIDPNSPQGMFMIASLVRGGVYLEKRDR